MARKNRELSAYLADAKKMLADRKAEIEAQQAEAQQLGKAIEKDEAEMAVALKCNDQERYQRAAFAKQYHAGRLDLVRDNVHSDVLPTNDEYEKQISAMREAYQAERIVLIDSLISQVESTMAKMDELTNTHNACLSTVATLGNFFKAMERNYIIRNDAESTRDEFVETLNNLNIN